MYRTEIRVKGRIDPNWSDWFGELHMQEHRCDETVLIGQLPDMSAVYGVISRLGSLVIPLISVSCVEEPEASGDGVAANGKAAHRSGKEEVLS